MNHKIMVIFDWDDTLLDVGSLMIESQLAACSKMLQDDIYPFTKHWAMPTKQCLLAHIGQRFRETISPKIFPIITGNTEHSQWLDCLYDCYKDHYRKQPKVLFSGVSSLLNHLIEAGIVLAIATNKSRDLLEDELVCTNIAKGSFSDIICGDDDVVVGKYKPHPQMLNCLMQEHTDVDAFVMVGDRDSDVIAAKNSLCAAATKTIAIKTNQSEFSSSPDLILAKASDISYTVLQTLVSVINH